MPFYLHGPGLVPPPTLPPSTYRKGGFCCGVSTFLANATTTLSRLESTAPSWLPWIIGSLERPTTGFPFSMLMVFPFMEGKLDAKGTGLWACKNSGKACPSGATTLSFSNSKNVVVDRLTSLNSQMFHIVINGCHNVKMQGVTVIASGNSPNTDGIHVQLSSGVTILNSNIQTGDDCISIGPGATNLWIEKITCGPGHGISIGSLGKDQNEAGVQNVTVKTAKFMGTQNGVRIKSWARPSSGFARNIVFQHIVMKNVENPIVIDQNYCPGNKNCPDQVSGVKVSNVRYQDIHGTSATQVAVKFDCSAKHPCSGIRLEEVKLTYKNEVAEASCKHAAGTISGVVQPTSCL
ncbi:hypothetical protein GOBAR_DD08849 [Gossypium barbadense]|nr:hypothetical protein GOBAR_DD08849 [Gossypium barbadense]